MSYSKKTIEVRYSPTTFEERIREYCNSEQLEYSITRRTISEDQKTAFEYAQSQQLTDEKALPLELGELEIDEFEIDYSIYENKLEIGVVWEKEKEAAIDKIIEYLKNKD